MRVTRKLSRPPAHGHHGGKPTVSVVIPCYNYETYLPQAAESALSQADVDVDVIIVDDASTDGSANVAKSLAESDPRVRVLLHRKNVGPVGTFNDGLPLVRGEYLVRLDADDLLTPGSLRRSIAVMTEYPSVGLVYGHPLHFSGNLLPEPRLVPSRWTIWPGSEWLRARCRDAVNVITSPEVVMRTAIVRQIGGQKDLAHTHDMEMWFRISAYSDIAYIHGADQAWHREHARSLSAMEVDHYRDLEERYAAFQVLFDGVGAAITDLEVCRSDAFRAISEQALVFAARDLDHGRDERGSPARFVEFARKVWSVSEDRPAWRAYSRRIRTPPIVRRWHPCAFLARANRKLQNMYRLWYWHRNGVFGDL